MTSNPSLLSSFHAIVTCDSYAAVSFVRAVSFILGFYGFPRTPKSNLCVPQVLYAIEYSNRVSNLLLVRNPITSDGKFEVDCYYVYVNVNN